MTDHHEPHPIITALERITVALERNADRLNDAADRLERWALTQGAAPTSSDELRARARIETSTKDQAEPTYIDPGDADPDAITPYTATGWTRGASHLAATFDDRALCGARKIPALADQPPVPNPGTFVRIADLEHGDGRCRSCINIARANLGLPSAAHDNLPDTTTDLTTDQEAPTDGS